MIKNLILLATLISLFSFCYSFSSFDFVEASFIKNINIDIGKQAEDIKYNSDNMYLYLSLGMDLDDNSVYVFDTLSNKIINRITGVGKSPAGIDYNPDNKLMYVTNRDDNSVSVINSSSNEVIKNITGVGNDPKDIIYNPENHLIYVTNLDDNSVSVINSSSNEVIKNITGVGNSPFSIIYNPDNKFMYVTNVLDNSVSVINSSSNEVIKNITDIGNSPSAIAYNPKNRTIYVAGENFMSVINSSNTITKRIKYVNPPIPILSSNILYNPFNDNIYTSDWNNHMILIFDSLNNNQSYIPMHQAGPMEYNPDNNLVYIANGFGIAIFDSTAMKSTINEMVYMDEYWDLAYNPEDDLIYATSPQLGFISVINSSKNISFQNEVSDARQFPNITIHDSEFKLTEITYRPDIHSLYVISPYKLDREIKKYSISVSNSDGELVKQIPISNDARLAYNPSNTLIYVASGDSLSLINSSSNEIISKIQDLNGFDLAYNSNNKLMYVTNQDKKSVYVINSSSNEVIKNITGVGKNPSDIAYNPDNKLLYIANFEIIQTNPNHEHEPIIFVINSSSNEVIKNITGVGKNPSDIAYNPDNNYIYITNLQNDSSISVINSSTNEVIKNITGVGKNPSDIAYNPDNNLIYVTNFDEGSISVINSSSNEVIKNINGLGKNPSDIAYNPDNKLLYTINKGIFDHVEIFDHVTIINPLNGDIIEKVVIGQNSKHILYNHSNQKMYITSDDNPGIIVMNTSKDG